MKKNINLLYRIRSAKILSFFIILFLGFSTTQAYLFGLKSADNSSENIQQIEKKYNIQIPMISYIFWPRDDYSKNVVNNLVNKFGSGRIFHITLPPSWTALEVYNWNYDKEYLDFFQRVKKNDIFVIFRTMHEMNWWRYPRASKPETFKKAWIHIRKLSRKAWLDNDKIAFDFSVNHYDMPTNDPYPNQKSKLIECNQIVKNEKKCFVFEDYYPWDKYVDVVWFTFYNRWKATSDRLRLAPGPVLYDKRRSTLTRVKNFWKPIIIDEVWTTAVTYSGAYSPAKSLEVYKSEYTKKNIRLHQLKDFLQSEKDIIWAVYFNVDYTNWLENPMRWEADRSIFNIDKNKYYQWWLELSNWWKKIEDSRIYEVFWLKPFKLNWKNIFIKQKYYTALNNYLWTLLKKYPNKQDISTYIKNAKLTNTNQQMTYIFDKVLEILW